MESMCHDESVIKTVGEIENPRLASIMTFISFGISCSKRIDLSASVSDAMSSESKRDTRKIIITYPFTIINKISIIIMTAIMLIMRMLIIMSMKITWR